MTVGAYIFGCIGSKLSKKEFDFFKESQPWGFILFSRNIESKAQVKLLTMELRESVGRNAPILIDQEGGRVSRVEKIIITTPFSGEYFGFLFSVTSGGCNGFNYDFNILGGDKYLELMNNKRKPTIVEKNNIKILIDPTAEMYLFGTTIDHISEDYEKGLFENKFIFLPDKKIASSCGCGISFTPKI